FNNKRRRKLCNMDVQNGVSIVQALIITLLCMGIVFFLLIVINYIINGFEWLFRENDFLGEDTRKREGARKQPEPVNNKEKELIAVFAAAIQAFNKESTTNEDKLAAMASALEIKASKDMKALNIK